MMMEVFLSLLTFSQRRPQIDSALLYSSIFQKFKLNNSIPLTLVQFCSYLPLSILHNKTMRERKLNGKKDIIKKCKQFFKFLHYLIDSTIYYENIFLHLTLRIQIVSWKVIYIYLKKEKPKQLIERPKADDFPAILSVFFLHRKSRVGRNTPRAIILA